MNKKRKTELPTDEQLIELLRKIKEFCKRNERCDGCLFENRNEPDGCTINSLMFVLNWTTPDTWHMEEIERIIKL